ncbi:uncharacterized protein BO87DRAFT_198552 [Aspergillus neoniger CBS 115656]|uniref:Uncharacterized protein n=1 Tax=Aspergillus neoniger (strain CBS 115656) TaxID=1448310 RepID=A0A318YLB8_ASPNB|nr:hypothetical protein BO87DRAFT_198552 [Aspergillus neoniger CBS 115656]PYH29018.1 hypothetical protein BO87DRAFT_198552 [Aspergillus neoniger CBS 115656]
MDDPLKSCLMFSNEDHQYQALTLVEGDLPLSIQRSRSPSVFNQSNGSVSQCTPIFRLQLDAPVTWRVDESWPLIWKLTYHGVGGDDSTSQPITFSNSDFSNWGVFCVYRRISDTGTWGPWRSYRTVGCHQFEDQDSPCTVGTSDMFVTLEPHETWIHVKEARN